MAAHSFKGAKTWLANLILHHDNMAYNTERLVKRLNVAYSGYEIGNLGDQNVDDRTIRNWIRDIDCWYLMWKAQNQRTV
jgi:hypothetical protein